MSRVDLDELVELAVAQNNAAAMRPVVVKELLHYDILFALDKAGLLKNLVFQGGTSLRLCYGSNRFSEDLDFVGGKAFGTNELAPIKDCIEDYLGKRYGLEVSVKEPKQLREQSEFRGINVDKWQVSVTTAPKQKSIPRQRIKIEIANIEAYTSETVALQANYEFLPDGYADTLLRVETLDEIMADKLISLANTEKYIRHRDIWDLRWLKQKGAAVNGRLVTLKISDYKIDDYAGKVARMQAMLPEIIHGDAFRNEMKRFIPVTVQEATLAKAEFYPFLTKEVTRLYDQVLRHLSAPGAGESPEFVM